MPGIYRLHLQTYTSCQVIVQKSREGPSALTPFPIAPIHLAWEDDGSLPNSRPRLKVVVEILLAMGLAADAEDVGGLFRREADELPVAAP